MNKFLGTLEELKAAVALTGFAGDWSNPADNHYQYRAHNGAVLNWWNARKKTINFQGPESEKRQLEVALEAALGGAPAAIAVPPAAQSARAAPAKIFVVHGHDDITREQLERILLLLGLEPFVLQNTSGQGLTIIESLERQIGKTPEAEFGIVLMTPDDVGYAKREGEANAKPRPRQNVVLEMGMLLSSLTRERVAILVKGHIEQPSDAHGIIYLHFNDHVKEVVPRLVDRLRQAGFNIDPSQISRAAS
ncbi:nucleotide-binding protein [Caenispirillum bisanense]|uniref:nucleotide-binding protein n=1 Tax=Caenispirillum bisanense TaxID=414052 RepID=UPI0031E235A8